MVTITINGEERQLDVDPSMPLLWAIRETLGLSGTKFDEAGKLVAAICHAGWMLVSADIIRGRTVTSYFSIKDDLVNAGGNWVDEEVVVDGNLVTSRTPDDLPAFMRAIISVLSG